MAAGLQALTPFCLGWAGGEATVIPIFLKVTEPRELAWLPGPRAQPGQAFAPHLPLSFP